MRQRRRSIVDVHLILRRDGRILMLRRANTGYGDGRLHLPSGHLERNESVVDGVIREAKEEVGVVVGPSALRCLHVMYRADPAGDDRIGFFFDAHPVHASWLNQVEIFFFFFFIIIVGRKVVTPNDFTSLDQVGDRLTAFEQRYNATARPFRWKFTPADLEDLLARIERHEQKESNLQQHDDCDHQPAVLDPAA